MTRFQYAILAALAIGSLCGCELYFGDDRDPDDAAQVDADVMILPPSEPPPDECLGPDCAGASDAGVDAAVDAPTATHPPFPQPNPCDTCVGFSCETVCADAGIDAL